jgi:hypothetical protein
VRLRLASLDLSQSSGRTIPGRMTLADATLAVFTLFNTLRFLAYVPQIACALKDRSGAQAISIGTWSLFLVSHLSAMVYAIVNQHDWTMATLFLLNGLGCALIIAIATVKRSQYRRHLQPIQAWSLADGDYYGDLSRIAPWMKN